MKTAKSILEKYGFEDYLCSTELINDIKLYAKQAARQALKDASERATYIRFGKLVSINIDSITNTEIKTP